MRNSGALSIGTHRRLRFAGAATLAEFRLDKSCGRDCAGDRLGNYSAMNFAMVAQRLSATFRRLNNINGLPILVQIPFRPIPFGPRLAPNAPGGAKRSKTSQVEGIEPVRRKEAGRGVAGPQRVKPS